MKKAAYFFCPIKELDACATGTLEKVKSLWPLQESGLVVDGMPAYMYIDPAGNRFDFVSCDYYLSHRYEKYLPMMNEHFADYDVAGYINWHGGANAPDKVLTVHTIGDVITGKFAPSNPLYTKNLAVALEKWRVNLGLEDFTTYTEATHWSGAIHGSDTALLEGYPVPMLDIEIGSEQGTLENPVAQEAIARALTEVFQSEVRPRTILALGGIHFDETYSTSLKDAASGISVGHYLPTIWLVQGGYEEEAGLEKLFHAVSTIEGGIDAVVYNDNMKKPVKDCVRAFAARIERPLYKHRRLYDPAQIEW